MVYLDSNLSIQIWTFLQGNIVWIPGIIVMSDPKKKPLKHRYPKFQT